MTPEARHYRDLLNTVKARLRQMQADTLHQPAARAEAGRIADFIAARLDVPPKEEKE